MGSAEWVRTAKTDAVGLYYFDNVPQGRVAVGVASEGPEGALTIRRIRTLQVADDPLYLCDVTLGDGSEVRGKIEFPEGFSDTTLCLELQAQVGAENSVLASLEAPVGSPFAFEDVPLDPQGTRLTLRISVAPGFHVDRHVLAHGPSADIGTFSFQDVKALTEFNKGERSIFAAAGSER